jgi:hypothetical protein
MPSPWKLLLTLGLALVIGSLLLFVAERFGFKGLPGDITWRKGNTTIVFPIVTCLVLSVVLTLVMRLFR